MSMQIQQAMQLVTQLLVLLTGMQTLYVNGREGSEKSGQEITWLSLEKESKLKKKWLDWMLRGFGQIKKRRAIRLG
jgi:hypothetical protein